MRITLIGCTLSTLRCLEAIQTLKEMEIVAVLTFSEEKGREKARYVPLQPFCAANDIPIHFVDKIGDDASLKFLEKIKPDLLFEVGWSQRIPKTILDIAPLGCIGIHNSLLPANQGAASINWALIRDEPSWGVTLFHLAQSIDAGDIIAQRSYDIDDSDDVNSLFDKADTAAVRMLTEMIPRLHSGSAPRIPQDPERITRLPRRTPEDGMIDWTKGTREIWNLIRALKNPYPLAWTVYRGRKVGICDAHRESASGSGPGVIECTGSQELIVGTSDGGVSILRLRREGEEELSASEFIRNYGIRSGDIFGN